MRLTKKDLRAHIKARIAKREHEIDIALRKGDDVGTAQNRAVKWELEYLLAWLETGNDEP
jgi:hypothetical protein